MPLVPAATFKAAFHLMDEKAEAQKHVLEKYIPLQPSGQTFVSLVNTSVSS